MKPYCEIVKYKGNWIEDYSHENGNYTNTCKICGNEFLGHKRRIICKCCSQLSPKDRLLKSGLISNGTPAFSKIKKTFKFNVLSRSPLWLLEIIWIFQLKYISLKRKIKEKFLRLKISYQIYKNIIIWEMKNFFKNF